MKKVLTILISITSASIIFLYNVSAKEKDLFTQATKDIKNVDKYRKIVAARKDRLGAATDSAKKKDKFRSAAVIAEQRNRLRQAVKKARRRNRLRAAIGRTCGFYNPEPDIDELIKRYDRKSAKK